MCVCVCVCVCMCVWLITGRKLDIHIREVLLGVGFHSRLEAGFCFDQGRFFVGAVADLDLLLDVDTVDRDSTLLLGRLPRSEALLSESHS